MNFLLDPNLWLAFGMLTALEVVLGIDNVIFLTLFVGRLPPASRDAARRFGLAFAMVTRILLLLSLSWVMGLTEELFSLAGRSISGRDVVLLAGGGFLLYKATREIFAAVEKGDADDVGAGRTPGTVARFWSVVAQIAAVDIVFSLDSVITAVGMVDRLGVMIAAVIASVAVMLFAAKAIGEVVERHPSIKILALAFLVVVGMTLAAEAFDVHVPKGMIYAAMGFSLLVETLNIRARATRRARSAGATGAVHFD